MDWTLVFRFLSVLFNYKGIVLIELESDNVLNILHVFLNTSIKKNWHNRVQFLWLHELIIILHRSFIKFIFSWYYSARICFTWAFQSVFVEVASTSRSFSIDSSIDDCCFLFSSCLTVVAISSIVLSKRSSDAEVWSAVLNSFNFFLYSFQ